MSSIVQRLGSPAGVWTPVLTCGTPGNLSVAYSSQTGTYYRSGRLVLVTFGVVTSSFTHTTASGNLQITGLPFTCANDSMIHVGGLHFGGVTKASYTNFVPRVTGNAALLEFTAGGSAQVASTMSIGDLPTGGSVVLRGSLTYPAA